MCFFASMYPRQVKMSNVYLNFFCLNFRWGEKLDIKIWFYCFQFPRVQILLFVGWNSTRVRKSKSKRKFLFAVCCCSVNESKSGDDDTAATIFKKDVFRNRRAPSPTSWRFSPLNSKTSCTRRSSRRRRGCVVPPADSTLPRCTLAYKSKFLFVFVCFVSLVFLSPGSVCWYHTINLLTYTSSSCNMRFIFLVLLFSIIFTRATHSWK